MARASGSGPDARGMQASGRQAMRRNFVTRPSGIHSPT